jgi:hypothetical protein
MSRLFFRHHDPPREVDKHGMMMHAACTQGKTWKKPQKGPHLLKRLNFLKPFFTCAFIHNMKEFSVSHASAHNIGHA